MVGFQKIKNTSSTAVLSANFSKNWMILKEKLSLFVGLSSSHTHPRKDCTSFLYSWV